MKGANMARFLKISLSSMTEALKGMGGAFPKNVLVRQWDMPEIDNPP
jgi:hypothetical protein